MGVVPLCAVVSWLYGLLCVCIFCCIHWWSLQQTCALIKCPAPLYKQNHQMSSRTIGWLHAMHFLYLLHAFTVYTSCTLLVCRRSSLQPPKRRSLQPWVLEQGGERRRRRSSRATEPRRLWPLGKSLLNAKCHVFRVFAFFSELFFKKRKQIIFVM